MVYRNIISVIFLLAISLAAHQSLACDSDESDNRTLAEDENQDASSDHPKYPLLKCAMNLVENVCAWGIYLAASNMGTVIALAEETPTNFTCPAPELTKIPTASDYHVNPGTYAPAQGWHIPVVTYPPAGL